jgi:hypothetical protein
MIDVKQAVTYAVGYLREVFAGERILDIRLEEVELSEDEQFWCITLSFLRESKAASSIVSDALQAALGRMERDYKILAIRSRDGQVKSMKIRQPV